MRTSIPVYSGQLVASPATVPTEPAAGTATTGSMSEDEYWAEGDIRHTEPFQDEPERNYGRRADEKRSYAQQAQDAQASG